MSTLRSLGVVAFLAVTSLAATSLSATSSWAGDASIAVIYPHIGEPYREIFEKIIEGIENEARTPLTKFPLHPDTDINALKSSLARQNIKVVIALGRQGMKTAALLDRSTRVVVGGVLTVPESEARGQSAISLAPDPALLFSRLKTLMPSVKRVSVAYDPTINGWLMKAAHTAARAQGLELVAHEAKDVRSAVRIYQEFFSAADSRKDALWLPQDSSTVEESAILPLVLQESWNQNIAVFSSNSTHVRRGVLFSLYPDNVALGKTLARLAKNSAEIGKHGMMPLRDVQIAVNLRTAKHLELNLSHQQNFDMTFPEQ